MTGPIINESDMEHCREAIRHGSLSFHAASRLLPPDVRDPALALYAFCRSADDAVDITREKRSAVDHLHDRLDAVYRGAPRNAPADRAFAAVVDRFEMPRTLPEALLEGFDWDAQELRYGDLSGVISYAARVASAVGVMMCVLMRMRDPDGLARAADLGVAMQLTNIARDVGEDALEGRLYLPLNWLAQAGIDPEAFLADPRPTKAIRFMVKQLLIEADRLYHRSEVGIRKLPMRTRPGIFAARYIYAAIGGELRRMGHDSINDRAHTSRAQKLGLLGWSMVRAAGTAVTPMSPIIFARPLPEVAYLVEAAADKSGRVHWSNSVTTALRQLRTEDLHRETAPHLYGRRPGL